MKNETKDVIEVTSKDIRQLNTSLEDPVVPVKYYSASGIFKFFISQNLIKKLAYLQ